MAYTKDTIQKLDFFEAVRKYPGMYIGSKDTDGLHHLAKEIISNSIDEYLNGSCDAIDVVLLKDGGLKITDNGRGIPIGTKEDGKTALELCFTEEHAGGKFLNATGESGYNSAGGMHGLGTKCVNALSDKMIVRTTRDGESEYIIFINGEIKEHKTEKVSDKYHGVEVVFYPSLKYLETIDFDASRLKTLIQEFSFLCKGLQFTFINEKENNKVDTYLSKNGLYDYLDYLNKDKITLCKPYYFEESEGTFQVEVAFTYNEGYSSNIKLYTNNIPQEKGTHLTGFKTAFTSTLNQFAREKGWLKEKDQNLAGSDFEEGQLLIINFKMIDPVFKGQNKEELSSSEGRTYVQKFSAKALRELFDKNEKDIKKVIDKALLARKAREKAKAAREAVRGKAEKKKKALKFDSKLADANAKNRLDCELYVTEGDSASGNLKMARNENTQAVIPVRGKVLNCEKATMNQILKNAEIMTMLDAFFGHDGWNVNAAGTGITYDMKKLRYGKVIIASDADVDGAHIKNLFYTFIWKICPELINQGHVYALVAPLYRIIEGNGKSSVYLKDDAALFEYRNSHTGKKYEVKRMKGLGEMDEDETKECLTDPVTRNIRQVHVEDADAASRLFNQLMGDSVIHRKQFLKDYGNEAMYNAE